MIRTILKAAAAIAALLVITAGVLYAFGARVILDGGGGFHVGFVKSAEEQAEAIARHREAQRAQMPASPSTNPEPALAPSIERGTEPEEPVESAEPVERAGSYSWPDFRGPRRDGVYTGPIRANWPASGLTPMWKQPAGGGYASFVTARGRAFTIEQRGSEEVAAAYDIATGRELWTNRWNAAFREMMGGDGPRATPTWSNGRVYFLGATGELRAIDGASGRVIWRKNILDDNGASNLQWGMAAAPLIVDDTVVVLPGGPNGRSVVAYDAANGQRVWSALDDQAAYSSPMLVTLGGVRQILVFTATRLAGLTPDGGRVLWEYPWRTTYDVNASQPVLIGDNRVFVSTGYGTGAAVIEVPREGDAHDGRERASRASHANGAGPRAPASERVGESEGRSPSEMKVREIWRNIRMKNQFSSSVLYDGHLYGLDESILACIDASTGDLKWKGGRYGYGQVMLADGHLIVLTEGGDIALVRATPAKHEEISRFKVFDAKTWNHPAIANGILLVRNLAEMAAFDLRR